MSNEEHIEFRKMLLFDRLFLSFERILECKHEQYHEDETYNYPSDYEKEKNNFKKMLEEYIDLVIESKVCK